MRRRSCFYGGGPVATSQIYLIRHGQSSNNAIADQRQRTADPGLTHSGHAQAQRVARHLKEQADKTDLRDGRSGVVGHGIERLYCSAMLRTLQTAQPIGAALGLAPEVWLDVHESGGIWLDSQDGRGPIGHAGVRRSELAARFPGFRVPDAVTESGWWNRPFERPEQMVARAARVADAIRSRLAQAEGRSAIVSHGTFLNMLIAHLTAGGPVAGVFFSNHNTAISRLDFDDDRVMLRYLNRIDHLPPELVT